MPVAPFARRQDDESWSFPPVHDEAVFGQIGHYELRGHEHSLGGPYEIVDLRPGGAVVVTFSVRPDESMWSLVIEGCRHEEPSALALFAWWVAQHERAATHPRRLTSG